MRRYYSKSLISNNKAFVRTVVNPVDCGPCDNEFNFDPELLRTLYTIDDSYVDNMAKRKYLNIPNNMDTFLALDNIMSLNIATVKNSNVKLLLDIAQDGLIGSLHSRTMITDNTELTIKNTLLERKIEEILSGKNEVKAMDDTCGEFVITKTFKLAPVYSYYITLYGLPAFGVGFDPSKLTLLVDILRRYGIEPYR
jgi:hypothetical protein